MFIIVLSSCCFAPFVDISFTGSKALKDISYNLFWSKVFCPLLVQQSLLFFGCYLHGISFHPFAFNLFVSLDLKWVSYSQHMVGSCVLIHSANLHLLIERFDPFIFKRIIGKEWLLCFPISLLFLVAFFVPYFRHYCCLLCLVDFFCSEMFKFLSHFFLCIFCSCFFVVTMAIEFNILKLQHTNLNLYQN